MISVIMSALGLFVVILAGMELGRWVRRRRADGAAIGAENSEADGVVFAVLGLLVAFTFTSSASHFDERRRLIASQANALGTAWSRVDMFAEGDREPIRGYMREWVTVYLETMPVAAELDAATLQGRMNKIQQVQDDVWRYAMAASERIPKPMNTAFVLSPMSEWINLTMERVETDNRGLPPLVLPTLVVLAVASSVLAGFNMAKRPKRSLLHMGAFAGAVAFCIYVIIDMNNPRAGLIRIDAADHAMKTVYATMMSTAWPSPTTMTVPATRAGN